MSEVVIDLSKIKFSDSENCLFSGNTLNLKHKNFIFAKNGAGKSTLAEAIKNQQSSNYDVQVYKGFEELIGENENLNAFSLSVNAKQNEQEIKRKEIEITQLKRKIKEHEQKITQPDDEAKTNLFTKYESAKKEFSTVNKNMETFFSQSAAKICSQTNPSLVVNQKAYNKNKFEKEIEKASSLTVSETEKYEKLLLSKMVKAEELTFSNSQFKSFLKSVNEIIQSRVEAKLIIERLDSQAKINYAQEGLKIHVQEKNQICTFCGNEVPEATIKELKSYFSADEVEKLKDRIKNGKEKLKNEIEKLSRFDIKVENFYPDFITKIENEVKKINEAKQNQLDFWKKLEMQLENKEKNLFSEGAVLELEIPQDINVEDFNILVKENNDFSETLETAQNDAREKLRYHSIQITLNEKKYYVKKLELENKKKIYEEIQEEFKSVNSEILEFNNQLTKLQDEVEDLKPKAEKQAVDRINQKLKLNVQWELDFCDREVSGYYRVKQNGNFRSVKQLSTGEKNLIALLYFVEKLEDVKTLEKNKRKIVIFDDPMNSNDDTMQYLIINELQKIYQGKYPQKYNPEHDFFIVLTHNIHFYLNVQPHGSFKDQNGRTKYDKNNFYRIQNSEFIPITSEKEDFATSYEALWFELKELYECDHKNAMLNSMRRIIETFIKFNSINPVEFYEKNGQYKKLFDVNSHSIDDLSAATFT